MRTTESVSTPPSTELTGGCTKLHYSGAKACLACPHKLHSSCTGGRQLFALVYSGRYIYSNAPDHLDAVQLHLGHGPLLPYLNALGYRPTLKAHYAKERRTQRLYKELSTYPAKLRDDTIARLQRSVGDRLSIAGYRSNALIGVLQVDKDQYAVVTANSHTFRQHPAPWITRMPGREINAGVHGSYELSGYLTFRLQGSSPRSLKLDRCTRWMADFASRNGYKVVV